MAPSAFAIAEAEQNTIKATLAVLEAQLAANATTPLTEAEVDSYLELAATSQRDVVDNFKTLNTTAPRGTDLLTHNQEYTRAMIQAIRLHSGFHGLKSSFPQSIFIPVPVAASAAAVPPPVTQKIKLPPLELPKFSGNLQEWISFRDLFTTAVHRSSLTNVEKLTQLKSLLTGEAARQVKSLILSDVNYDIAWKSLQERYENKRELLFSLLRRLITQPPIQSATAVSVRSLIDTTKECVRSLDVLSMPTQHWDAIVLYLLFTKLDAASRELWEQSLVDTSIPDVSRMYEFLEQRARALAAGNSSNHHQQQRPQQPQRNSERRIQSHHVSTGPYSKCKVGCSVFHPIYKCPIFKQNLPHQRLEVLKKNNLCFNCFMEKHSSQSCPNQHSCKVCNQRHHTMLHSALTTEGGSRAAPPPPPIVNGHTQANQSIQAALLATAAVRVMSSQGEDFQCRAFLDNGSSVSFITESTARRLRLKLHANSTPVTGLSSSPVGIATHTTSIVIKPHFDCITTYNVNVLVINRISSDLPTVKCDPSDWPHIRNLQLADPRFGDPAPVDLLLGSDVFWNILGNEKLTGSKGQPLAIKSSLGWLIAGQHNASTPVNAFITNAQLDSSLQRFWDQEELHPEPIRSTEEEECVKHFTTTHSRNYDGRFVVAIPWKNPMPKLGDSRRHAVQRLLSLENRLVHQKGVRDAEKIRKLGEHWTSYKGFMLEYEQLGHMKLLNPDQICSSPSYYIPHHFVVKESSTTTKLRVVFDASAPTSNGISLNSCMMVGPQLQENLLNIMLRFRSHPIAFTADVEKMYRQIVIREEDRKFQRILWREDPSQPIREYELTTVTYGTTYAPFVAVQSLQQLGKDEENNYPIASKIVQKDFYVDDVMSGDKTADTAKTAVHQLINICEKGGFQLRKWTSNSEELLLSIPEDLRETKPVIPLEHESSSSSSVKTLGVSWNPVQDEYHFKLELPDSSSTPPTKRVILSEISKIFDPCGWLAPALITFKIFMQELWKTNLPWDSVLPEELINKWNNLKSSLHHIERITIPRCVIPEEPDRVTLCGFSDASMKAYSAVVYVCCTFNNKPPSSRLLASKTRVAPVRAVTLPRLELNGAVLLSELLQTTISALQRPFDEVRAYTDSTITLCWIQADPNRWKIYVRNRVQTVINNIPQAKWFHIPGDRNPADCASRGIPASELTHHPLWWNAVPEVFDENYQQHHAPAEDEMNVVQSEEKPISCHVAVPAIPDLLSHFSSFHRFQRVAAWMFRFLHNCKKKKMKEEINTQPLSSAELQQAHNAILRNLQSYFFPDEIKSLQQKETISNKSKLPSLHPFLSDDGLLRVGGRIRNSSLPFHRKFPILLPRAHHITTSIIKDTHLRYLHAGPTSTIGILNQRYWIVRVRDAVRIAIKQCVTCTRHAASTMQQFMGDLPSHRVNPSRPFSKVGIDYAGPFSTRSPGRSKIVFKCWLAIFVCFSTRALHIEVVSELSTNAFIAALRRFVSRRGPPSDIFSDCGTNFKGADKVLRQFASLVQDPVINDELSAQQICWHFNPPGAPHFGGLWEAGVRSIKHHLIRVVGQTLLTYEEMLTLVCQVEAILNSRPLTPASTDPSDLEVLTPAHFLIGGRMTELPQPSFAEAREGHLDRWQLIQHRQQQFWKRWQSEFLTRLQQRPKWARVHEELQPGNMVLIKDERMPPLKWKLGRVIAVHPGKDGHVRVASIKTADGEVKRPIVKLSLLPITN